MEAGADVSAGNAAASAEEEGPSGVSLSAHSFLINLIDSPVRPRKGVWARPVDTYKRVNHV